jgi:YVTN family beta-propeller protein
MKKHFYAIAALILITAISGCGKKTGIEPVPPGGDTTPPYVTISYPPGDTVQGFDRRHTITITFSEGMEQSTVPGAFSANGVPGSFYWLGNTVTFVPDTAFAANDTVFVSVTGNALDLADNGLLPAFSKWYLTSDSLDTIAPTVAAHQPLSGSEGVSVGTNAVANASEQLSEWSAKAMTMRDSSGNEVAGNCAISVGPAAITFGPGSDLKYNTRYYVTIDTTLRDLCWNRLATPYTWSFRTELDTVKPRVVSVSPAAGDTNITVNAAITVCFSEPMDKATAQAALSLTPAVEFKGINWQGDTLMTAALVGALSFKKQYRITVDTTARDAAGNRLAAAYSSNFTTLRGLLVLCNTVSQIQMYQQTDLKPEGYLGSYSAPRQIRISADDSLAYVLTQNGVEFIQLKNQNNHLGTVNLPQTCYGLALSPNGLQLAVTDTTNDSLYIISTATMQKTGSVKTGGIPKGVCFNQGGKVAVLCWGKVEIYTSSLVLQYTTIVPNNGEELVKGNGDTLYAASGTGISAISFSDGSKVFNDLTGLSNHPFGLAFSPDGAHLALACYDEQSVRIYSTSGAAVASVTVGTRPKGLCYSPDGTKLYVSNSGSSNISVISRSGNTYALSSTVTVGSGPWGIAVTP